MTEQSPLMRLYCPLSFCTWVWDRPLLAPAEVPATRTRAFWSALAGAPAGDDPFGHSAFTHLLAHMLAADAEVEKHLKTHTLLEWLTEVTRLQADAAAATGRLGEIVQHAPAILRSLELAANRAVFSGEDPQPYRDALAATGWDDKVREAGRG